MAEILLQYPQSMDALLLGAFAECGRRTTGSSQYPDLRLFPSNWNWGTSFSPDVRAFDKSVQLLLCDWEWLRQTLSGGPTEELEVDYSYMARAGAAAQVAPDMIIDDEDIQAYAGLGDFSYTLDDDD